MKSNVLFLIAGLFCCAAPAFAQEEKIILPEACTGPDCLAKNVKPADVCDGQNCRLPPSSEVTQCEGQDCDAIPPSQEDGPEIEKVDPQAQ